MCQRSSSCLHLAAVLGLLAQEDESASRAAPDWTAVTACAVVVVTTRSVLSQQATATAGSFTAATLSARRAQWWSSSITVIKLQSDLCMLACLWLYTLAHVYCMTGAVHCTVCMSVLSVLCMYHGTVVHPV